MLVDDHLLDDVVDLKSLFQDFFFQNVYGLIEPRPVRAWCRAGQCENLGETTETSGVPVINDSEGPLADGDDLRLLELFVGNVRLLVHVDARVIRGFDIQTWFLFAHASSPFIWWLGVAASAAASAFLATSARFTPRGSFPICSRSTSTA